MSVMRGQVEDISSYCKFTFFVAFYIIYKEMMLYILYVQHLLHVTLCGLFDCHRLDQDAAGVLPTDTILQQGCSNSLMLSLSQLQTWYDPPNRKFNELKCHHKPRQLATWTGSLVEGPYDSWDMLADRLIDTDTVISVLPCHTGAEYCVILVMINDNNILVNFTHLQIFIGSIWEKFQ